MLWEMYQQGKIRGAETSANQAENTAERASGEIAALRKQVERLSLACQGMWELLRDRSELSEAELDAKIMEIDGRDGKIDGKIGAQMSTCPSCGRPSNSRRSSCVICGAELKKSHAFET